MSLTFSHLILKHAGICNDQNDTNDLSYRIPQPALPIWHAAPVAEAKSGSFLSGS
jgi:hypothetical protein